jgi:alpha-beta hydrolase superfamily lysophospholipase
MRKTMNTRFATSHDSTRIAFDLTGAGTPLLLLHGGGGSRADWHENGYVARLHDEFTVIAVDMRGHGESDKPTDPAFYFTEKMGQDILALANACNVEHFILCGYSFGGMSAATWPPAPTASPNWSCSAIGWGPASPTSFACSSSNFALVGSRL